MMSVLEIALQLIECLSIGQYWFPSSCHHHHHHQPIKTTKTDTNATKWTMTNLKPYTVYSFRVIAVNKIGPSELGQPSFPFLTSKEAPSGRPAVSEVYNTSSTTVIVEWTPPPNFTHHGRLRGYKLTYRRRNVADDEYEKVVKKINFGKVENLGVFTEYIISLRVFNGAGDGPKTVVSVMTGEGGENTSLINVSSVVPTPPRQLSIATVTKNAATLTWAVPVPPNGIITGYNVYCVNVANNITTTHEIRAVHRNTQYILKNLITFNVYKVWVTALTKTQESNPTEILKFQTDAEVPSKPEIINMTCFSTDTLFVQWIPPKIFDRVDLYTVFYRSEHSNYFEEIEIPVNHSRPDLTILIHNLTENTMYVVKVQGITYSIINEDKMLKGSESDSKKIVLQKKCWSLSKDAFTDDTISAGIVAGIIFASFCFLLSILSFVLWRKYFQASYYYLDDPPFPGFAKKISGETYDSECDAVPVALFPKHVADLHADGDIGFSREYESLIKLSTETQLSSEQSQTPDNKNKNRYINILAYDHSRVLLKALPGQKKAPDYINANYIDGYNQHHAYIGTQGPMPATFGDYWRMIWEQRVYIIVMITNLVERGRKKCDMYWPSEGASETYGIIQVKVLEEINMATYIIRTISIKNLHVRRKKISERIIYQYHYTSWQDHGVPEHPLPVLSFIKKSASANPENAGPIIVHCSAGVGRTGTYIVLDTMLRQIKYRGSVNVKGFLNHIRQQRNYLVQTEEQYIFLHDALVEAIESGESDINAAYLSRYIQSLQTAAQPNSDKGWVLLEKQFKLVTSFTPKDYHMASATKACNISKNRNNSYITLETSKVHLTPKPGIEGSDYINASFIQGFSHTREFIITQHPLEETVPEFWQMIWDHNVHMIVLLTGLDEEAIEDKEVDYGNFKLNLNEETMCHGGNSGSYTSREFCLASLQDDDVKLTTKMLHHPKWPETCSPLSSVFELINIVQNQYEEFIGTGPLVVIDRFGGTEAATFCCLTSLNKQLEYENHVDVYQNAKLCHIRRPGIWKSQDDYLFLYRAVESIVSSQSNPSSLSSTPTPPPDIENALNGHILRGHNSKSKSGKHEKNTSFV
ncbi:Tyrosine-protein phosphatase 99A [Nymphon striatum]|nr:Tyrosine-protein phosphatase 99A [Nymphon striatum]